MNNRNYNFKIRLNSQQRVKLLQLSKSNGFQNVSQFIRQTLLNNKQKTYDTERILTNNSDMFDYDTVLKIYQKIKFCKTTDEYLNYSDDNFLYVISDQNKINIYKQLLNLFDKKNIQVMTLKDYLNADIYSIKNKLVVFQNSILLAMNNFGLNNYNKTLQLNKTLNQLIGKKIENKNQNSQIGIQDTQVIQLVLLSNDFKNVKTKIFQEFGSEYKHKFFGIYWLNDYIEFEIKDGVLSYNLKLVDTQKIIKNLFNDGFVYFQQLKNIFENSFDYKQPIKNSIDILQQVSMILKYLLEMNIIKNKDKENIKKLLKIEDGSGDSYTWYSDKYSTDSEVVKLFSNVSHISDFICNVKNKKQPFYSLVSNTSCYNNAIKSLQQNGFYSAKRNLQMVHALFNVEWNIVRQNSESRMIMRDILKNNKTIQNNKQQSLFGEEDTEYTNEIIDEQVSFFNASFKDENGMLTV